MLLAVQPSLLQGQGLLSCVEAYKMEKKIPTECLIEGWLLKLYKNLKMSDYKENKQINLKKYNTKKKTFRNELKMA